VGTLEKRARLDSSVLVPTVPTVSDKKANMKKGNELTPSKPSIAPSFDALLHEAMHVRKVWEQWEQVPDSK
jgi:hypothetical protein